MRTPAAFALALCLAAPAAAEEAVLPSGLVVTPHDRAVELQPDGEAWLVLRYLAPGLAGGAVDYEQAMPDLEHLCDGEALALAEAVEAEIALILVILMDRPVVRGEADPGAVQYIGAFLPSGEGCLWE